MDSIEVEQVSPAYTSQRCTTCGFTHENNRRSKHQFECQKCGYRHAPESIEAERGSPTGDYCSACGGFTEHEVIA